MYQKNPNLKKEVYFSDQPIGKYYKIQRKIIKISAISITVDNISVEIYMTLYINFSKTTMITLLGERVRRYNGFKYFLFKNVSGSFEY